MTEITNQFRFTTTLQNPDTFLYNISLMASLTDPSWKVRQVYTLTRIDDDGKGKEKSTILGTNLPTPPVNIGPRSTLNYTSLANAAVNNLGNRVSIFAGQGGEGSTSIVKRFPSSKFGRDLGVIWVKL